LESSKWVTFFNPHFKRGRPDLLVRINRCTQSTAATNAVAAAAMAASAIEKTQQKQSIDNLEGRIVFLEKQNADMTNALHSLITTIQSMQEQLNTALASDMSTGTPPSSSMPPGPPSPVYAPPPPPAAMIPPPPVATISQDSLHVMDSRKPSPPKQRQQPVPMPMPVKTEQQQQHQKSNPTNGNKDTLGPLEMMATVATNTMSN